MGMKLHYSVRLVKIASVQNAQVIQAKPVINAKME